LHFGGPLNPEKPRFEEKKGRYPPAEPVIASVKPKTLFLGIKKAN
jgi:hypothetical protein